MKGFKLKWLYLIILGVLATSLIGVTGCNRTSVFIPKAIQLEPPPIMITVEQLYKEYMADEVAADARYKGEEVWVIEAKVDSYHESESGCYFIVGWYTFIPWFWPQLTDPLVTTVVQFGYVMTGSVRIEPKSFLDLQNIKAGSLVDIVGKCQGLSNGLVTIDDCWIEIKGAAVVIPGY